MLRLLAAIMISILALTGMALADDDYYDEDDRIIPRDSAPPAKDTADKDEDSAPAPVFNPGTYFGDGDPRYSGAYPLPESRYADGIGITTSSRAAYALREGGQYQNLDTDQIYGPLWGVPEDAVGLESYQHYYDLMMLGNPEMLPEGYQLPHQHNHAGADTGDHSGTEAQPEQRERKQGLELSGDDDW